MSESRDCDREVLGIALIRHLLRCQSNVISAVKYLKAIQIDPVSIVAPNQDLVLGARIEGYSRKDLEEAIEKHMVLEVYARERCFVPMESFPLYWPTMLARRKRHQHVLNQSRRVVAEILEQIAVRGPLPAGAFSGARIHNQDQWGPRKQTTALLDLLWQTGYLAIAQRHNGEKLYDLMENVVPSHLREVQLTPEEARLLRCEQYVSAVGLADVSDPMLGFERANTSERKQAIHKLLKEGKITRVRIRGAHRQYVTIPEFSWKLGDVVTMQPVLIPPLDNLLWRRERLDDIWNFHYRWEIYTSPEKRAIGPYGMPLVGCDRILGQADVRLDRECGALVIRAPTPLPMVGMRLFMDKLEEAGEKLARLVGASRVVFSKEFRSR